jgi:hypothetical protein
MSSSADDDDDDDVDYLVVNILFLEVVDLTTLKMHTSNQHENSLEHKSAPLALISRETSERVESKLIEQLESQEKSWQIFL